MNKKLERLTPEQESLMRNFTREYIDYVVNYEDSYKKWESIDKFRDEIKDDIYWIYEKAGLSKPAFIFVAGSYIEEKLMINYIIKTKLGLEQVWMQVRRQVEWQVREQVNQQVYRQVDEQVYRQVDEQVRRQVEWQVRDQIWDQVEWQVDEQMREQVEWQVDEQVREQVEWQVDEQVRNQTKQEKITDKKLEFVEQMFGLPWNSWLSFYSFFQKIGIVKNDDFDKYCSFIRKGVWSIQFFKNWCIVTPLPKKIHRDTDNRLHNVDGPAIKWQNNRGYLENYFIHGVPFEPRLWERVVRGTITIDEILRIENQEQKAAILSVISPNKILDKSNSVEISRHIQPKTTNSNNKPIILYEMTHLMGISDYIYILMYEDPSTDRKYFSFVPPDVGRKGDAAEAMAWKFGISKELYIKGMMKET